MKIPERTTEVSYRIVSPEGDSVGTIEVSLVTLPLSELEAMRENIAQLEQVITNKRHQLHGDGLRRALLEARQLPHPGERSHASFMGSAASNLEKGYDVGCSGVKAAVTRVLRVVEALVDSEDPHDHREAQR